MQDFYQSGEMIPGRSIGYFLRRIERLMMARAEPVMADTDISFAQWISLTLIRHDLANSCSELSRSLGHNSGATTRLVDQLEERGLVTRVRDGGDRRVVTLSLTEDGERTVKMLTPRVVKFWNDVLGEFERAEVETLLGLLARLMGALERYGATENEA